MCCFLIVSFCSYSYFKFDSGALFLLRSVSLDRMLVLVLICWSLEALLIWFSFGFSSFFLTMLLFLPTFCAFSFLELDCYSEYSSLLQEADVL